MQAVNKLLDTVRLVCKVESDSALAKRLHVTRALVSGWRQDRYHISDEKIAELCEMAELDAPLWVAEIHAEMATTKAEKAMWRTTLDRLSAVATAVALVLLLAPGLAQSKSLDYQKVAKGDARVLYIMF